MPLHPWRSSRWTRALAVVACVLASWTCDQETAGPGRRASLAVAVLLPPTDLAAFNLAIDNARLIVVRPPADTVFDKVFSFPANQSSLPVSADVPLEQSPATFQVTIQLLSGATVLFEGTQDVTLTAGETSTPAPIPVTYSGPGQNVATLTIDPADSALSFGGSLTFRPTARDGQGEPRPELLCLVDHERYGRGADRRDRHADRADRAQHRHRHGAHAEQRLRLYADHIRPGGERRSAS